MQGETDEIRDDGRDYPLLWAIVEFREELEKLVEAQLALIAGRVEGEDAPSERSIQSIPPPASPSMAPPALAAPPAARTVFVSPAPSILEAPPSEDPPLQRPRPREAFPSVATTERVATAERATATATATRPTATPEEPAPAEGAPDDSRRRLDALAKLLDRRLKPSPEGTPTPTR